MVEEKSQDQVSRMKDYLMKITMTIAMKMDSRAMEIIFPTGSGRDSLDLQDLIAISRFSKYYYVCYRCAKSFLPLILSFRASFLIIHFFKIDVLKIRRFCA